MSTDPAQGPASTDEWPRFTLRYTFGSPASDIDGTFEPDEVIVFDPTKKGGTHWVSAEAGWYVPLERIR
ncbi:hypothetical protein [Halegenticoccus soli]|uniref:hypothetical protein n=1 Tax=Halegenticoccus soli TaxID=1985678 RepID=UPI000C6EA2FE|nr:hypothetical protein [Halegenticoccus soli]